MENSLPFRGKLFLLGSTGKTGFFYKTFQYRFVFFQVFDSLGRGHIVGCDHELVHLCLELGIFAYFFNGSIAASEIVHGATAADIPAVEQRLRNIATAKGITLP